jgi:hypothetical protein
MTISAAFKVIMNILKLWRPAARAIKVIKARGMQQRDGCTTRGAGAGRALSGARGAAGTLAVEWSRQAASARAGSRGRSDDE